MVDEIAKQFWELETIKEIKILEFFILHIIEQSTHGEDVVSKVGHAFLDGLDNLRFSHQRDIHKLYLANILQQLVVVLRNVGRRRGRICSDEEVYEVWEVQSNQRQFPQERFGEEPPILHKAGQGSKIVIRKGCAGMLQSAKRK